MLSKKYRLNLSSEDNSSIFMKGCSKVVSSEYFLAYFRENEAFLRVSCIAPKALLKKACLRNFYRRLIYSFLEKAILEKRFFLKAKKDLVIVLKRNFSKEPIFLEKDFSILIDKIK